MENEQSVPKSLDATCLSCSWIVKWPTPCSIHSCSSIGWETDMLHKTNRCGELVVNCHTYHIAAPVPNHDNPLILISGNVLLGKLHSVTVCWSCFVFEFLNLHWALRASWPCRDFTSHPFGAGNWQIYFPFYWLFRIFKETVPGWYSLIFPPYFTQKNGKNTTQSTGGTCDVNRKKWYCGEARRASTLVEPSQTCCRLENLTTHNVEIASSLHRSEVQGVSHLWMDAETEVQTSSCDSERSTHNPLYLSNIRHIGIHPAKSASNRAKQDCNAQN